MAFASVRTGASTSLCSIDDRVRRVQSILTGFSSGMARSRFLPTTASRSTSSTPRAVTCRRSTRSPERPIQFGYDSGGRLSSVTDVDGDVTQINHDASGDLRASSGPFGETTTFAPDTNGYLASGDGSGGPRDVQFTYDANGLMQTKTNPRGGLSQYSLRLARAADARTRIRPAARRRCHADGAVDGFGSDRQRRRSAARPPTRPRLRTRNVQLDRTRFRTDFRAPCSSRPMRRHHRHRPRRDDDHDDRAARSAPRVRHARPRSRR